MDFEGSLDEVRFYNRSFSDSDIAILYGNGNGDLGLTPVITLDADNSASVMNGRLEFLRFGQPELVEGLTESDLIVSGGNLSNLSENGQGYAFDFSAEGFPAIVQIGLSEGAANLD